MHQDFIELLESNEEHFENFQDRFDHVQDSQKPDFVTVCCSDSRVLQDHMWGNEHPGKNFTISNIGNRTVQNTDEGLTVSGDVLYPIEHTGTKTAVVVGHTGCGAVTAAYRDIKEGLDEPSGISYSVGLIEQDLREAVEKLPEGLEESKAINRLVEYNVDAQVEYLKESEDIPEDVDIIGVVYDFQDVYSGKRGQIHVININGEKSVSYLRKEHSEVSDRIERLWEP